MRHKLILSIGNPGSEYARTFHSAGHLLLAYLAEHCSGAGGLGRTGGAEEGGWRSKLRKYVGVGRTSAGQQGASAQPKFKKEKHFSYVETSLGILARSDVFMNESGTAVREALRKFRVPKASLLLLHDDSDLALGEWKLQFDRSPAGHHGVESAVRTLGSQKFWRLRIGVRPSLPGTGSRSTGKGRLKAGAFVLRPLSKKDEATLYGAFGAAARSTVAWSEKETPLTS